MWLNDLLAFRSDLIDQAPLLLSGLQETLRLALAVTFSGLIGGIVLLYLKLSHIRWLQRAVDGYIAFFVGTPLIVMLFVMYYGLPTCGVRLSPFLVAWLGFTLNVAAYNAAYLLGGYRGLDGRELEAARSQGFSTWQVFRLLTLPQVMRTSVPSLSNQMIANLKDSSYAFLIGYTDLFARIQELASGSFQYFHAYLFAALVYLVMVGSIVWGARQLEIRLRRF